MTSVEPSNAPTQHRLCRASRSAHVVDRERDAYVEAGVHPVIMAGVGLTEVRAVLTDLAAAGCSFWVGGGWGVDALVGRQTREHRDLDLGVDADDEAVALRTLEGRGHRIETDWRPVRVELAAAGRGWVDLHPVRFDTAGHGRQAGVDGGHFDYPPDAFDHGMLDEVRVPCLQIRFHLGYEPRAVDRHDLALLDRLPSRSQPRPDR